MMPGTVRARRCAGEQVSLTAGLVHAVLRRDVVRQRGQEGGGGLHERREVAGERRPEAVIAWRGHLRNGAEERERLTVETSEFEVVGAGAGPPERAELGLVGAAIGEGSGAACLQRGAKLLCNRLRGRGELGRVVAGGVGQNGHQPVQIRGPSVVEEIGRYGLYLRRDVGAENRGQCLLLDSALVDSDAGEIGGTLQGRGDRHRAAGGRRADIAD